MTGYMQLMRVFRTLMVVTLVYTAFAFAQWEWHPGRWYDVCRWFFVAAAIACGAFAYNRRPRWQ